MNPRIRTAAGTALSLTALTALAACSSDSGPGSDKPKGPTTKQLVTKSAYDYMHAWMAEKPADAKTMCELQTKASRPNFDEDGGTLADCIKESKDIGAEDSDSDSPLHIKISHVQNVPASASHPAGKGVLATMHRAGEDQFRYVLRLVHKKEGDKTSWLIEQTSDGVSDRYAHTADPVAPVLAESD